MSNPNHPNHFVCLLNALHRFLKQEEYTQYEKECPDATCGVPPNTKQGV